MQAKYAIYRTPLFDEEHLSLRKRNKEMYERIEKAVEFMKIDPFHNARILKGADGGQRRKEVSKDVRILFAVCLECRQTGHQEKTGCANCSSYDDYTVILFGLARHA